MVKAQDRRADEFEKTDFKYLLRQSLCARFAESMAQWTTVQVAMGQNIVRAAFGYSMVPDHSHKRVAFELTGAQAELGMTLTESNAINPSTSVCAMLIAHKEAGYFDIKEK